jgi:hypothetical protein
MPPRRRSTFWAPQPPTGYAFPQTCRICGCCGHNVLGHQRFCEMYPHMASNQHCAWTIGPVIHRCNWCCDWNFEKHVADVQRMHLERSLLRPKKAASPPEPEPEPDACQPDGAF